MALSIKVGDIIPEGSFPYIPYTAGLEDKLTCGIPSKISTDAWKDKKVVIFSVPGAFTPTCHIDHLPQYIQKYDQFKAKGVDVIAVIAANDLFVMSGWGRFEGVTDKILTLSDVGAEWSKSLGLSIDLTAKGLGVRTARYAIILDHLVVKYVEVEPSPGISVSGADAVLAHL